ncbi:MAG: sodium-dependent transporter [Steroidobacteraceae bacterium]
MPASRDSWSSNVGFLLAAVGSAVGLGTIWRFPYSLGVSGGGAYIFAYLIAVALIVLPILMAEMMIGRRAQRSPPAAIEALARESGATPAWRWVAIVQFLGAFIVLAFYCVVGGWTLAYLPLISQGAFANHSASEVQAVFDELNGSAPRLLTWHAVFLALTAGISFGGVRAGIEKMTKVLMPLFFVMLTGLAVYASQVGDFSAAATFLFAADFSKLTAEGWLNALGQAFFSIGAGATVYIAYASYAGESLHITRAAWIIVAAVTVVSVVAGLAIFPLVFSYGLSPASGPGLAFVTLPLVFAQMPGGTYFGALFFVLLFVAAVTSSISMLEVTVSWLEERYSISRHAAVLWAAVVAWLLGVLAVLSFNVLSDVHPLGFIEPFATKTFFDLFNEFAANILLPVGGLCIIVFAGWIVAPAVVAEQFRLAQGSVGFRLWRLLIRYLAPLALLTVFIYSLIG